jgi:hypothetical protein
VARSAEFLIPSARRDRPSGLLLLALKRAAKLDGWTIKETEQYEGHCDLLVLYGVGSPDGAKARWRHVKSGRRAILWDLGYFGRKKHGGSYRVSIDTDHPQAWIDGTEPDASRLERFGISLREDHHADGPIVLVGLGRKSRRYIGAPDWEAVALHDVQQRFPGRRVVFRPKPGQPPMHIGVDTDERPIEQVLRGASLVVCRHSNVAIDAIVAGVPFEAKDGAALALREFTPAGRMDFLRRLAWWQWHESEGAQAWQFLKERVCA